MMMIVVTETRERERQRRKKDRFWSNNEKLVGQPIQKRNYNVLYTFIKKNDDGLRMKVVHRERKRDSESRRNIVSF